MGGARVNRHNKSRGRAEGQSTGSKVCPKFLSRLRVVVFLPLGLVAQHDCHPRLVIVLRHCEARPGWVKVQLVKGIGVNADSVRPSPLLEVDNVTLSRETRGYHVITFARNSRPSRTPRRQLLRFATHFRARSTLRPYLTRRAILEPTRRPAGLLAPPT